MKNKYDAYIQWIELTNVQEVSSVRHECTHAADWLELNTDEPTRVTLKKIIDKQNESLFDFYQVN